MPSPPCLAVCNKHGGFDVAYCLIDAPAPITVANDPNGSSSAFQDTGHSPPCRIGEYPLFDTQSELAAYPPSGVNPFFLAPADGFVLSVAIVGVWATAFAVRAAIRALGADDHNGSSE